ncbi:MAG: type II toxin-antitoxin system RelB/DinJ family antitoxin [Patescibacteria group bacterium]
MNTIMTVRIDSKIKSEAQKTFAKMGLDLSSAVKLFMNQSILEKGLPFKPRTVNGYTKEFENRILNEDKQLSRNIKNGKSKGHNSITNLYAKLMN